MTKTNHSSLVLCAVAHISGAPWLIAITFLNKGSWLLDWGSVHCSPLTHGSSQYLFLHTRFLPTSYLSFSFLQQQQPNYYKNILPQFQKLRIVCGVKPSILFMVCVIFNLNPFLGPNCDDLIC